MSLEERAFRKATRRLIPFLFFIYVVAYLDRVNVSFAQLQLEDDLDFSDTIFGLGAGIFSLGYVIFGVPSNLALARFGARRWLAAIMIAWGVISASMLFIDGPGGFYVLRFLLGAAEAGFFPGIILFLTWWFPERHRTPALALFFTAVSVAYVFGGPLSGGLLELDNAAGLDGWQWLFLLEGLPAIALGEPPGQEQDDAGEEACLCRTQQKAHDVEARRAVDEHHRGGDGAPDDHDRREPAAGAEARKCEIARHPEDHVAQREDPRADPEDRVAEVEVVLELELREAHVHAVEVRDHVDEEEERDEPARRLPEGAFLEGHAPTLTRVYFTTTLTADLRSSPSPEVPPTIAVIASR